ncbi:MULTISPECIES: hypothetical protein [unclassified Chamaesiphon]|uniref:hypothetical protein n=1 Tax=unclassified Chamaesiphon TaxID=2620921 RepID=UPI00286D0172|nr:MULTISPECIES: hypothetical protein [unclassified Chamaesiphon]
MILKISRSFDAAYSTAKQYFLIKTHWFDRVGIVIAIGITGTEAQEAADIEIYSF